jgi:hypothetical protein
MRNGRRIGNGRTRQQTLRGKLRHQIAQQTRFPTLQMRATGHIDP